MTQELSRAVSFGKNPGEVAHNVITVRGGDPDALELRVFFHSHLGLNGTSTLICGKEDAILVSATILPSDGHRLAAGILETERNLTHIVVPEFHPDHWFSLALFQDAFPKARIVAMQSVARDCLYSSTDKFDQWSKLDEGKNFPSRLCFPMPLSSGHLEIEGRAVELSDGWNADMMNETVVWIPSIRAAIPSDLVFYEAFPWTIESDVNRRQAWRADLKKLRAMKPRIVIPGHTTIDRFTAEGTSAIDWTVAYLDDFDDALAKATTGDQLVEDMESRYPGIEAIRSGLHWHARILFPDSCSDRIRPLPGVFHTITRSESGEIVYR
jgi:glyoxylase-like metal-dependent hydrolase (beta-lactamase superfamily II)